MRERNMIGLAPSWERNLLKPGFGDIFSQTI
jgi:hypothetical protein